MAELMGWICVHRPIQDHWLWEDKPFSYGQAWIDMLLLANHADNKFPLGKEIVTVPRGSFITSELKLMDRWGWSKSKVRRFLELLESDSMIIKKADNKKTTITIENYSNFQDLQTAKEQQKDFKKTSKRHQKNNKKTSKELQKDTNNNDNNDNNDNNVNKKENVALFEKLLPQYSIPNYVCEKLNEWFEYKEDRKDIYKEVGMKTLLTRIEKLTREHGEIVICDLIDDSMINGWQGIIFDKLKDKKTKTAAKPSGGRNAWIDEVEM